MSTRPNIKNTEQQVLNDSQDSDYGTLSLQLYAEQISDSTSRRVSGIIRGSEFVLKVFDEKSVLSGTGNDASLTLTLADTAYQVPASGSVPASDYVLVLFNSSDTNIYWRFTTGTSNGCLLDASTGKANFKLSANQVLYVYCSAAGKVLNYSTKII